MLTCCCTGCLIGSDDFSANDGNPHAGWTNRPAIYSTAGGDEATNTGGVFHFGKPNVQKFNTANPEGVSSPTAVYTKFKLHETVTGDGVRFIVPIGYLNDDTYLFARVDYFTDAASCVINGGTDSGEITLFKRVAGVESALLTAGGFPCYSRIKDLTLDVWHEIWVCLIPNNYGTYGDGDTLRARVKLNGVTTHNPGCQGVADGFTGGTYAGLGNAPTSGTTYGEVEFDDFKYYYFRGTDHLSCPNCNGPCPIYSDNFAYSDTEQDAFHNLNCMWFAGEADGTTGSEVARFASGMLEIESGSRVVLRVPHPTAKTSKIVTVSFLWESGIVVRVDLGTGYALFDSTNRRMFLYDNDGNLLDSTAVNSLPVADDAVYSVEVCYAEGVLIVTAFGLCESAASPDTGDPFVYLGSDGGTVHFDSFSFSKHKDLTEPRDSNCDDCECPGIPCDGCQDGNAPEAFVVTHPDLTYTSGAFCSSPTPGFGCDSIPRSALMNQQTSCQWNTSIDVCFTPSANATLFTVRILEPGDGLASDPDSPSFPATYRVRYSIENISSPFYSIVWHKDYGLTKPDCSAFFDEELAFWWTNSPCDPAAEPVLLTAV